MQKSRSLKKNNFTEAEKTLIKFQIEESKW